MTKVILGGGLSGLSAAYYLLKKAPSTKISIIEASSRTGGWIKSSKQNGYIFEQGPRTIRPKGFKGINTLELIHNLGLQHEVYPIPSTHPAALNRMIYANGELHTLPSSLLSIFKTNTPFSKPLAWYLINDITAPRKRIQDESMYDFIARRFGNELADYAISPLICGVCAGDAKEISVKFLMEDLFQKEQKYGNIYKGIIYDFLNKSKSPVAHNELSRRAKLEKWSIYSFKDGIEVLPKALEQHIKEQGVHVSVDTPCNSINVKPDKVVLHTANGKIETDKLISTIPAGILSSLIEGHPQLSSLLKSINSVDVCVINLHYKKKVLSKEAFGFLVPPKENLPILGVIFDSCCFQFGENDVLTVMMGGHWFQKYFGSNTSKDSFLNVALKQIGDILGIYERPNSYQVNILQNCIPQYTVGHNDKVNDIMSYIKNNNLPLVLCGASYYGVGVNDVIWSAKTAIDSVN